MTVILQHSLIQFDIHIDPTMACPIHDKRKRNHQRLSLQCHPIQLDIHMDPSIGTDTYGCQQYSWHLGCWGSSWDSKQDCADLFEVK